MQKPIRNLSVSRVWAGYRVTNEDAARVILQNADKYGGESGLMVQWAVAVIEKQRPTVRGPLFSGMAGSRKDGPRKGEASGAG